MSLFYRILYSIGFTPWEHMVEQATVRAQVAGIFAREQEGRTPPFGDALDLGCGSGIHSVELARRGWRVTGVDDVPRAIRRARARARAAGVEARFVRGDITALDDSSLGRDYRLVLDFGAVHGVPERQRAAVGRGVDAVAAASATLWMLAFSPGRRGPMPRGLSRAEIESTYPNWEVTDVLPQAGVLPPILEKRHADPRWYRLRRKAAAAEGPAPPATGEAKGA